MRIRLIAKARSWEEILSKFPKDLQAEIVDERGSLKDDPETLNWLSSWHLASRTPVEVKIDKSLILKHSDVLQNMAKEVLDKINANWGTDLISSGKVHDPNPDRYEKYSKLPANTAKPSIMVDGEIIWGVGRFIAACLRKDSSIRVWKIITH